jgi:protein-L-isoaspartate(D-aspartate) O-methyltransferase
MGQNLLLFHILLKYQDVFLVWTAISLTGVGGFDRDPCMVREPIKFERQRAEMVTKHIEARGITDPLVLEAMRTVPRHLFVSEALADQAYGDFPLPIGDQQTISQPFIVAEMTQALELKPDDRVLEIGTGSGYQAAILAEIVFRVYTIERLHPLFIKTRQLFDRLRYYNIVTRYSDGTTGWPDESPFDAIIITAGAPKIPHALINQLAMGGRMVLPVGGQHSQDLIKIEKDEEGLHQSNLGGCRFVKLVGEQGWKAG